MKKLYSLCMFALFATASQAQSYDVGVAAILLPDTTMDLPLNFNDTIGVVIVNYGDSLVSGDTISVIAKLTIPGGTVIDSAIVLTLPLAQTIPSGVGFGALSPPVDLSSVTSQFAGMDIEVCFRTNLDTRTDANAANDEYCFTYTVESNTTTSITIAETPAVRSFYTNNALNIQNNKEGNNVSVYNLNGQVVFQNANGNSSYSLNLSKGLYIVHISDESGLLNNSKIFVD